MDRETIGRQGGFVRLASRTKSPYLQDGKLTFAHNVLTRAYYYITATEPVPTGGSTLRFDFAYAGGRAGAGGTGSLRINDRKVGEGSIPQTAPYIYHRSEGLSASRRSTGSVSAISNSKYLWAWRRRSSTPDAESP